MAQHNVDASKMELYMPKERDLRVHWAEPMLGSVCNIPSRNRLGLHHVGTVATVRVLQYVPPLFIEA